MSNKKKRKATPAQLRALARGRKKRLANIRKARKSLRRTKSTKSIREKSTKRRRRNSTGSMAGYIATLTGGSRDVNPQFINVKTGNQIALNQTVYLNFVLPVTRIPGAKRVTLIEILKLYWQFNEYPKIHRGPIVENKSTYMGLYLGNQSSLLSFDNPLTIANKYVETIGCQYQAKTEVPFDTFAGFYKLEMPWSVDLTDGAGHGMLVAVDSLTLVIHTTGYVEEERNGAELKILYRFKGVTLQEYVGIVQSQQ